MKLRIFFLAAILFFASNARAENPPPSPEGAGSLLSPLTPPEKNEIPPQKFDAKIIKAPPAPITPKKIERVAQPASEKTDSILGQINQYPVGEESEESYPPTPKEKPIAEAPPAATEKPTEKTEEEKATELEKQWLPKPRAIVQVVDKTKARSVNVKSEVNKEYSVGSLVYTVKKCFTASENYAPDNAALIEITEKKSNNTKTKLFYGWMFSSGPALTFIENSVYDVVISNCGD